MAYLSQILLARWMGGSDYGVYVYVWTWVLLLGSMMDFGISASAQKIIPEYRARGEHALLRGFLSGSRWMTFAVSAVVSLLLAGRRRNRCRRGSMPNAVVPLYIGCLTLPAFVVANTQDGIARSHDWMRLGLMPQFIVRQSLIIGFTAGAFALGFDLGATAAMLASARRGLDRHDRADDGAEPQARPAISSRARRPTISAAGSRSRCRSCWSKASICCCPTPTCWCCSNSALVRRGRRLFRRGEDAGAGVVHSLRDVGDHGASLCRISRARRQRRGCRPMSRMRSNGRSGRRSPRPSLLLALGKPLLWLFGPQFVVGYDIMFIAAIGLVVRSAIGPVERLLNMLGHQHICALAYALAFVMNVVLCVALVPRFGGHGAAAATSISLVFETVLLFWIVRQRLGLHVLAFGQAHAELSSASSRAIQYLRKVVAVSLDCRMSSAAEDATSRGAGNDRSTPRSSRRRSTGWRR